MQSTLNSPQIGFVLGVHFWSATAVFAPDPADRHVWFDERDVETEHGEAI